MPKVKVKSGLQNNQVALWERHPEHKGNEIYIAGDAVYTMAKTPAVARAIVDGRLVLVGKQPAPIKKPED